MIPPVLITVYSDGVRLFVEHVVLFLTVISVQYAYFVKQNNFCYDLCGQFICSFPVLVFRCTCTARNSWRRPQSGSIDRWAPRELIYK